jgi:hypothetical protein
MARDLFEDNLTDQVRGGKKIILLVSKDLERLEGACIRLSKDTYQANDGEEKRASGRKLFRWKTGGRVKERDYDSGSKGWKITDAVYVEDVPEGTNRDDGEQGKKLCEAESFEDVLKGFNLLQMDALLWLPIFQPRLIKDGALADGPSRRGTGEFDKSMSLVDWNFEPDEGGNYAQEDKGNWPGKTILIGGMAADLPPELGACTHTIRWDFPSYEEIRELLTGERGSRIEGEWNVVAKKSGSVLEKIGLPLSLFDEDVVDRIVRAVQGLDIGDCRVVLSNRLSIAKANVYSSSLNEQIINDIMQKKIDLIGNDGLLEIYHGDTLDRIPDVKGLENLVEWIEQEKGQFHNTKIAEIHGISPSKGLLLTGVPGCGKSLIAKYSAKLLKIPLLGFDLGKITSMWLGQTEERMHRALRQADGMAPCVLWIDEFEKMFSSASAGGGAGNDSIQRVNAIFLKWMEERDPGVFVMATSNDMSKIAAEYQRSGRWDGQFFFDLPSSTERRAILTSNLEALEGKNELTNDQMNKLVEKTGNPKPGWASSDLATLIKQAKKVAFAEWERSARDELGDEWSTKPGVSEVNMSHIEEAIGKITPISDREEYVNNIRWEGRKLPKASRYDEGDKLPEPTPPKQNTAGSVIHMERVDHG